jgi:hypothetical protein
LHQSETLQDISHHSPRPTICAQCEDKNSPVIERVDGFSFHYEIVKGVTMEIFLHDDCASRWYDAFGAFPNNGRPEKLQGQRLSALFKHGMRATRRLISSEDDLDNPE